MSLVRLRTFVEVYRQRSISGAARVLNLTQPAVSQHIAGLEATIGRDLFIRQAVGVQPTIAADELAADIGDKLDASELALALAKSRSHELTGTLQIIGHSDFMAEVLPVHLAPLLSSGMKVRLQTGNGEFIHRMLIDGHCDLGFTAYPTRDKRLQSETIMRDRVCAVASPVVIQRLSRAKNFLQALTSEPMLTYNLELSMINNWLSQNKLTVDNQIPALVSQDLRTIRTLLLEDFGWAVLPEYLCKKELEAGRLKNIAAPISDTFLNYFMMWTPAVMRTPRIAHAKQSLMASLNVPQTD